MKSIALPAAHMLDNPEHILVSLLVPIGDSLLCRPVLMAFRERFPHAHLTVMIPPVLTSIIKEYGIFDDVLIHPSDRNKSGWWNFFTTLQIIRDRDFDCILSLSPYGNVFALFAGIPMQIWHNLPKAFWLWGALDPAYAQRHATLHYWKIVEPLHIYPAQHSDTIPQWHVDATDRQWAYSYLSTLGGDPARTTIILHPGAEGYHGMKRWPAERFGELAREMLLEGHQIVIMGSQEDQAAGEIIQHIAGESLITCIGKTTLRQSIALIAGAQGFVGNDSGLSHFAAALGVPLVVLIGATSVEQFCPLGIESSRVQIVRPEPLPEILGYFIGTKSILFDHPRYSKNSSMHNISVTKVKEALQSIVLQPTRISHSRNGVRV